MSGVCPLAERLRDAFTGTPKTRFPLPIRAYAVLEEPGCGSLVTPDFLIVPITSRVGQRRNISVKLTG